MEVFNFSEVQVYKEKTIVHWLGLSTLYLRGRDLNK